jgi:hypothetical protein
VLGSPGARSILSTCVPSQLIYDIPSPTSPPLLAPPLFTFQHNIMNIPPGSFIHNAVVAEEKETNQNGGGRWCRRRQGRPGQTACDQRCAHFILQPLPKKGGISLQGLRAVGPPPPTHLCVLLGCQTVFLYCLSHGDGSWMAHGVRADVSEGGKEVPCPSSNGTSGIAACLSLLPVDWHGSAVCKAVDRYSHAWVHSGRREGCVAALW